MWKMQFRKQLRKWSIMLCSWRVKASWRTVWVLDMKIPTSHHSQTLLLWVNARVCRQLEVEMKRQLSLSLFKQTGAWWAFRLIICQICAANSSQTRECNGSLHHHRQIENKNYWPWQTPYRPVKQSLLRLMIVKNPKTSVQVLFRVGTPHRNQVLIIHLDPRAEIGNWKQQQTQNTDGYIYWSYAKELKKYIEFVFLGKDVWIEVGINFFEANCWTFRHSSSSRQILSGLYTYVFYLFVVLEYSLKHYCSP